MKKMNYNAPQIEVVRFDTEDVLAETLLSSKTMDKDVPAVGEFRFDTDSLSVF